MSPVWPGRRSDAAATGSGGPSCEQLSALNTSPGGRQSFLKLTDRAAGLLSVGLMPVRSPDLRPLNYLQMKTAKTDDPFCVCLRLTMKPEFRVSTKPETWGPKPDQAPPLRPINANTFYVTFRRRNHRTVCNRAALPFSRSFQSLANRAGSPGPCSPLEARLHQAASLSRPRGEGCSGSLAPVLGRGRLDVVPETLSYNLLPTPLTKGMGRKGAAGGRKRKQRIPRTVQSAV